MSETFSEKLKRRFEEKRRAESIGNLPVEERRKVAFAEIGRHLDGVFNAGAEGEDRKTGFILMVFPFHGLSWENHVCVLNSNAAYIQSYNISMIPTNFLIDGNGVILASNLRGKALEEKLASLKK